VASKICFNRRKPQIYTSFPTIQIPQADNGKIENYASDKTDWLTNFGKERK